MFFIIFLIIGVVASSPIKDGYRKPGWFELEIEDAPVLEDEVKDENEYPRSVEFPVGGEGDPALDQESYYDKVYRLLHSNPGFPFNRETGETATRFPPFSPSTQGFLSGTEVDNWRTSSTSEPPTSSRPTPETVKFNLDCIRVPGSRYPYRCRIPEKTVI